MKFKELMENIKKESGEIPLRQKECDKECRRQSGGQSEILSPIKVLAISLVQQVHEKRRNDQQMRKHGRDHAIDLKVNRRQQRLRFEERQNPDHTAHDRHVNRCSAGCAPSTARSARGDREITAVYPSGENVESPQSLCVRITLLR